MTGCGKTTLLRALDGLIPHYYGGTMSGRVFVDGMDTRIFSPKELSGRVGTVFQDPENQLLMLSVAEEIAFGLRNRGLEEYEVESAVDSISGSLGITNLLNRSIFELSSGQKQRVALASTLATRPSYILLDEPTSQLDEEGAETAFSYIRKLACDADMSVLVSEHRVARSARYCSRFIGMEDGRFSVDGGINDMKDWYLARGIQIDGGPNHVGGYASPGGMLIEVSDLSIGYGEQSVLDEVNLNLREGEIAALVGANGSGKTTLLKSIMNFVPKKCGKVVIDGQDISSMPPSVISKKIGYLSHNPLNYLFQPTLLDELHFSLQQLDMPADRQESELRETARDLGLEEKLGAFPREFSCGERELSAIACVVSGNRQCLLLDEPTRGMDYIRKSRFMQLIRELCTRKHIGVIIATHDKSLAAYWADRTFVVRNGRVDEFSPGVQSRM